MASTGKHALVFGASGIYGWGVVNEILRNYPSKETFSMVSGLTNRPLSREDAQWPSDARLHLTSGVDLVKGSQADLEKALVESVPSIETVTQFYFFSYQFCADQVEECKINQAMIERCVKAVEKLSPKLEHIILPSGTKWYGVHMEQFPWSGNLPLRENHPRIPEPDRSKMFYYHQHDTLESLSEGKKWKWTDVRADIVVGFVPNNNTYCLAQGLGIYFSLFAYVEGKGATCAFPGTETSWRHLSNDSSQDFVSQFSIMASLAGDKTNGRDFNVADNRIPTSWAFRWPILCQYFGLKGTGPAKNAPQPGSYMREHNQQWEEMSQKFGLRQGFMNDHISWTSIHFCTTIMDFDRYLNLSEQRSVGFTAETDVQGAWWPTFDKFKAAKIIA